MNIQDNGSEIEIDDDIDTESSMPMNEDIGIEQVKIEDEKQEKFFFF